MPRISIGPRLYKRPARRKDGKIVRQAAWVIRDGDNDHSTGCFASPSESSPPEAAKRALADYIAKAYQPKRTNRDIEDIDVADVLLIYLNDHVDPDKSEEEKTREDRHLEQTIGRLNAYWGGKTLAEINTATCKGYVKTRPGEGGARRDLEIMRAAINHHSDENLHYGKVSVWLPEKGEARDRWLTRSEAAAMIWFAYRYREVQTIHVGPKKGEKVETDRRPLRHVARFILTGVYTGTRAGSIASASTIRAPGKSFVDLERGVFYRKPIGKRATNKRQPPAPLPPRLLSHMRRWVRLGIAKEHFVEWRGKPVTSVKKAFRSVVTGAEIDISAGAVTPHTLRHTAATWLMQNGADLWTAAGYLGMTVEVLERVYGHHHPDHLGGAVSAITAKPAPGKSGTAVQSGAETGAKPKLKLVEGC